MTIYEGRGRYDRTTSKKPKAQPIGPELAILEFNFALGWKSCTEFPIPSSRMWKKFLFRKMSIEQAFQAGKDYYERECLSHGKIF